MADLNQLQQAIDEKRIDTRSLNREQKIALDEAFKQGDLKGYEGIDQYEKLIDLGALSVAQGKMQRLKPFEAATGGIDRGDFVLAGAVGFGMVPYMKEKDALVDSFLKYGYKDHWGIDTRAMNASKIYADRLSAMGDFAKKMKKVPGVLGTPVRAMGNLIGFLDDSVNLFKSVISPTTRNIPSSGITEAGDFLQKIQKFGPSPALAVETKSFLAGSAGGGLGAAAFDAANLGADFVGATSKDMANLTDNQIRKMPFLERVFVNAVDAAYTEMLWTAGAYGLVPIVRWGRGLVKSSLDLDKAQAKELAEAAERSKQEINIVDLIPTQGKGIKGAWQAFNKKFFTTVGVYPLVNRPLDDFNKNFNAKLTSETYMRTLDNLALPPRVNLSILNFSGANQIKNEFKNVWNAIETEYGRFHQTVDKLGNPKIIPLNNLRKTTDELIERLKLDYPEDIDIFNSLTKGEAKLTDIEDPLIDYVRYLNRLSDPGRFSNTGEPGFARLSDLLGLSRMQTKAYSSSKYKVVDNTIIKLRRAFELDVNSINEATNRGAVKDKILRDEYQQLLAQEGPEAAEALIDKHVKGAALALKNLQEANAFYSRVLRPYEKSSVAKKLLSIDRKLFASKGIDMTGVESIPIDKLFDKVIRNVLSDDSPMAIRELKSILGVTDSSYQILGKDGRVERTVQIPKSKESERIWNQYIKEWLWDSFNNSTSNKLRDVRGLSTQAIAEQAKQKGFIREVFDPLEAEIEQRIRAKTKTNEILDLKEVDARIFTEGNGIANMNEGLIRNHDFGELNIDDFVEKLGIEKTYGKEKFAAIFGEQKGKEVLKRLQDLIDVKRSVDAVPRTDPSKFVQRSLTLSAGRGSAGMTTAAVSGALLGIGNTLKLMLGARIFGEILASPKVAENVMGLNKWYRFALDKSEQSIFPGKGKIPLTPKMYQDGLNMWRRTINSFFESQGDSFRVDPDKIDFEEIRQKLESFSPDIPLRNTFNMGALPKFTRDRIYPEYDAVRMLSPEQKNAANQFFTGASLMGVSHNQFNKEVNNNPLQQPQTQRAAAPQPQVLQAPGQQPMTTGQTPQAPEQRAATYQALFPQDTLGTAIAAQGQQFNEGGLVQDAYAYADEVLNA